MTKEDIKERILSQKPDKTYLLNGEVYEMTDDEFEKAISDRVEMEWQQQEEVIEAEAKKASALAKLAALGLTADDLKALGL